MEDVKKTVEIFDEENSIVIDDKFDTTTFDFYPEDKKFKVRRSIKDDCFYNTQIFEYKLSANPIELYMRTLESSSEPPLEYSIKDGVVLESEIKKRNRLFSDNTISLKKEVEWAKIPILGNCEINLYIISKHPEIVSKEEYRRFIRQTSEKIKMGVFKVEEAIKKDTKGLQVHTGDYGKSIWYIPYESEKNESEEYWKLPEEKKKNSNYGKKFEYIEKFNDSLFSENSASYAGISDFEFRNSFEILEYLENLLNKKEIVPTKEIQSQSHQGNKKYTYIIYALTAFFIFLKLTDGVDWNWFGVLSPVLIWEGLGFVQGFLRALAHN